MTLEDIKREMPKTPEMIHNRIQDEIKRQMEKTDTEMKNLEIENAGTEKEETQNVVEFSKKHPRKIKWSRTRVAAVAAVCILGVSTSAYAGSKWYSMYVEKQGTYQVATKISADEQSKTTAIPDEIPDVKIQAGYLPDGMEEIEEGKFCYSETPYQGGFSMSLMLLDKQDFESVLTDNHVVESEERNFGKYEGVYLRYQDLEQNGSYNQRIYLMCPDEYRMAVIAVGDDMSKEKAVKFAENISLVETDKMVATKDMYSWSDFVSTEPEIDTREIVTSVSSDELKLWKTGEEFMISPYISAEDEAGNSIESADVSVKVDSVQISDDLSLLDKNKIPEEWKKAVGEDGKLVENQLSYMKAGDGVEALDEVVKTENVKQKLVFVTATYKNNSESTLNHILYLGNLMLMKSENGTYQLYIEDEQSGEDYDFIHSSGVANAQEMGYYSEQEAYGNGGNYISSLKPGESVQIEMAWIVDENQLSNMYLNLSGNGSSGEFVDNTLETGIVDIRQ